MHWRMLRPVQKLRWKYYNILLIVKELAIYKVWKS